MKRFFILTVTIILMCAFSFTGCGDVDRYKELSEILEINEESITETFTEETCDYEMFSDYIKSWAKGNSIDIKHEGKHSTVLLNPATEGCNKEASTTLLCNLKSSDVQSSLKLIATATTALLGPEKHGRIYLVITEIKNGRFLGTDEVPDKYYNSESLINLQTSNSDTVLVSGPRNASCTFDKKGRTTQPNYSNAFEISFTMPEYTDPYDFVKGNNYPNPVTTIGSLLATAKSSGKLFDIASFSCECHDGYTPYSAKAVVVIDDNNIESFTSKFNSSYNNIEKKFETLEADFVYTLNETDMPETVLGENTSNNLISLMYTLNTGVCLQDEETGIIEASSYIKNITTVKGDLHIDLDIRTRGESYLDSLSAEYETTAGLCSTKYNCVKNGLVWESDENSSLVEYFTEAVPLLDGDSEISLRTYENDMLAKKLPDLNMIIYTFESGNRNAVIENIGNFINPDYQN